MKHPPPETVLDPDHIAKSVRASIEDFLVSVPNSVEPQFASRIEKFAACLARWGSKMNLTAHPEDAAEITFHALDSVMPIVLANSNPSILADRFDPCWSIIDIGSGAGFPGLILAAASAASVTLVESRRKRASFLQIAIGEMGLTNVLVDGRRIEDIAPARAYDLATARAFGDPSEFFRLAAKTLKPGGMAILFANPSQFLGPQVTRIPYSLVRRGATVDRILALCRQPVDEPCVSN